MTMLLDDAIKGFADYHRYIRNIAASSADLYEWHLRRFERFIPKEVDLAGAKDHINPYLIRMGQCGLAEATRADAFSTIRSLYRWAVDNGHILGNPMATARPPIVHKKRRPSLSKRQVGALLGAIIGKTDVATYKRDYAMFATIYYIGLRISEAIGLRPEDVNLKKRLISFVGKGSKPAVMFMPKELVTILTWWIRQLPIGADMLFPSMAAWRNRPGRLDKSRVEKLLRETYAPAAALPAGVTPHTLRRAFGTHIYEAADRDIRVAQEALRHESIETTVIYVDVMQAEVIAATNKMTLTRA